MPDKGPPTINVPPVGSGGGSGGSSSGGSSSGGSSGGSSSSSSAPAAPKVDPVVAQKESLFQSIYVSLWGEPATEAYLKSAAQSGMNTFEFQAHEMSKPAFADTKTYQGKAQSVADLLSSLGVGRH